MPDAQALRVAIAELQALPAARAVYVRAGGVFLRTPAADALAATQRQLALLESPQPAPQ